MTTLTSSNINNRNSVISNTLAIGTKAASPEGTGLSLPFSLRMMKKYVTRSGLTLLLSYDLTGYDKWDGEWEENAGCVHISCLAGGYRVIYTARAGFLDVMVDLMCEYAESRDHASLLAPGTETAERLHKLLNREHKIPSSMEKIICKFLSETAASWYEHMFSEWLPTSYYFSDFTLTEAWDAAHEDLNDLGAIRGWMDGYLYDGRRKSTLDSARVVRVLLDAWTDIMFDDAPRDDDGWDWPSHGMRCMGDYPEYDGHAPSEGYLRAGREYPNLDD